MVAGLVGFVLCVFIGQDKMTGNPLLDSLLNGLAGALIASAIAADNDFIEGTFFGSQLFQRYQSLAPTSLNGHRTAPLVGEEIFERDQQRND
jgi:hypothetical protein